MTTTKIGETAGQFCVLNRVILVQTACRRKQQGPKTPVPDQPQTRKQKTDTKQ